jgi:peptidyl-prolyl cis-trans isomerase SurA
MTRSSRGLWLGLIATLLGTPLMAQQDPSIAGNGGGMRCDSTGSAVDRIIAVVGESAILSSQVEEEIFTQRGTQGMPQPRTPAEFRALCRQVISDLVDAEILVQVAQRDTSIKVEDQEIASGVDEQFRNVRQRFKSEVDFRNELARSGFQTPEEYRRWLTDDQRKAALRNRLMSKLQGEDKMKPVQPTEKEMQAYFAQFQDRLPQRPATIGFKNIVIAPKPQAAAKERTKAQADSIVRALRAGADFATAAKRFSQDPASMEQGGDLGWFRRGLMVPEFEAVAFAIKPGVISEPVESPFGYHIIQVQRVQPAEVQARHILLMPEVTQADADSAKALSQRISDAITRGASFDSLSKLYHDPGEERETADQVPFSQLPDEYRDGIGAADSGVIVPPFEIRKDMGLRRKYVVLMVTGRRPEGTVRYEDVKEQIRNKLSSDLAQKRYIDRIRRSTYVDIRM